MVRADVLACGSERNMFGEESTLFPCWVSLYILDLKAYWAYR